MIDQLFSRLFRKTRGPRSGPPGWRGATPADPLRYVARPLKEVANPPGPRGEPTWHSSKIGVFRTGLDEDVLVGTYLRNYPTFFRTFHHFRRQGVDYALYSPNYTCTRLLALPECSDLGGESPHRDGFCPIDYHVPCFDDTTAKEQDLLYRDCGFVAGCIWGDDSSYKIQFLDLSRVSEGIVTRDERFGYVRLPEGLHLADAISTHLYDPQPEPGESQLISMAVEHHFDVATGQDKTPDPY